MTEIKIIKNFAEYKLGEIIQLEEKDAYDLIMTGIAVPSIRESLQKTQFGVTKSFGESPNIK